MKNYLHYETTFGTKGAAARRTDAEPFRILLIGDYSGRRWRRARGEIVALRRPFAVDIEHFDRAIGFFQPRLLDGGSQGETFLDVTSLDTFHPDTLYAQMSVFDTPRRIRANLQSGGSIEQAMEELKNWLQRDVDPGERVTPAASQGPGSSEDASSALARLLGGGSTERASTAEGVVEAHLRELVRPHVVPGPDPRRQRLLQVLDDALAAAMRTQLSRPDFCALETAWRSAYWVASSLDTTEELQIFLFDATQEDIGDDVKNSGGALDRSAMHRLLVEGGSRWSMLAVNETFGAQPDELAALASLGALGARSGAPVLADTSTDLLGCPSPDALGNPDRWGALAGDAAAFWSELRASPIARHVGLVVPRILLRLPYGQKTDPIEAFAFEEITKEAGSDRSRRRWASGAFGAAILLGKAFQSNGWDMDAGDELELEDLPSHTFDDDGEQKLFPCAEWSFNEKAATAVLERGVNPVVAHRNRNAVRFLRIQSIADPPAPLSGAWGNGD